MLATDAAVAAERWRHSGSEEVEAPLATEAPAVGQELSEHSGAPRRLRGSAITVALISLALLGSALEVLRRHGLRETRPTCEEGEDPLARDCLPRLPQMDWQDPSWAAVRPEETLVELRWFKGKLLHPVGRFFGGHHSALVGLFSSGRQVRIEKFGAGSVQFCPIITADGSSCNLHPGELYKQAGGRFLKNITWGQLHKAMMEDLDHYDVVDANCHHAVQHGWNAAVLPQAMDRTPAPDHGVISTWEGFLRRFVVEDGGPDDIAAKGHRGSSPQAARALSTGDDNDTDLASLPAWSPETERDREGGDYFTKNGYPMESFDAHTVRRRRRRQMIAQRCRGSKIEGDDNCPQRASSMFEQSSSNGGPSSIKECELSSKCRFRVSGPSTLLKDKDYTGSKSRGQSDCKFQRALSSGGENDLSGSMHWRFQYFRNSQSQSSADSSQEERMPMEAARVQGNSKDAEPGGSSERASQGPSNSQGLISASEPCHSQAGRSKVAQGDEDNRICNTNLTGVNLEPFVDFLCQWTCEVGDITFMTPSVSTYVCTEDTEFSISLARGQNERDCLTACADGGCTEDCVGKCRYLASAALDAGQAVCMDNGAVTSTGYGWQPLPQRNLSPGVIVGIVLFCCCSFCCNVCAQMTKPKDQA